MHLECGSHTAVRSTIAHDTGNAMRAVHTGRPLEQLHEPNQLARAVPWVSGEIPGLREQHGRKINEAGDAIYDLHELYDREYSLLLCQILKPLRT